MSDQILTHPIRCTVSIREAKRAYDRVHAPRRVLTPQPCEVDLLTSSCEVPVRVEYDCRVEVRYRFFTRAQWSAHSISLPMSKQSIGAGGIALRTVRELNWVP